MVQVLGSTSVRPRGLAPPRENRTDASSRSEVEPHPAVPDARERHRFARGADLAPQRTDQPAPGALQDPPEGPPLASRAPEAGQPASPPARLPEEDRHRALPEAHRSPQPPQVIPA